MIPAKGTVIKPKTRPDVNAPDYPSGWPGLWNGSEAGELRRLIDG